MSQRGLALTTPALSYIGHFLEAKANSWCLHPSTCALPAPSQRDALDGASQPERKRG
jgi:hypothetical protein